MNVHGCGARWSGGNACHCAACHVTFSGLAHFDAHRTGDHDTGRTCRDPRAMQLVQVRPGVWGTRMTDEQRAKFDAALGIDTTPTTKEH